MQVEDGSVNLFSLEQYNLQRSGSAELQVRATALTAEPRVLCRLLKQAPLREKDQLHAALKRRTTLHRLIIIII
jgi:hypothetical protein